MKILGIKQPFYLSGMIHLIFFILIFISYLFNLINKDPEPKILMLVTSTSKMMSSSKLENQKDQLNNSKDKTSSLYFEPQLPVEITPLPKPKYLIDKSVKSPLKDSLKRPKISLDEFDKKHRFTKHPTQTIETINVPPIKINNEGKYVQNENLTSTDQIWEKIREKNLYEKQLWEYLYKHWEKSIPLGSSGLSCDITFRLNREGKIYDFKINGSSNDKEFDQSVIDMLRKIAPFRPPPKSLGESFFSQRFQSL